MNTKTCTKCGLVLEASEDNFYKIKGGKFGLMGICIPCCLEKASEYRKLPGVKKRYQELDKLRRSRLPKKGRKPARDLTGMVFKHLTVIEREPSRKPKEGPRWRCRCDCGTELTQWANSLLSGSVGRCHACGLKAKRQPYTKIYEVEGVKHKSCTKCKKILPLGDFEWRKDPRHFQEARPVSRCRECSILDRREQGLRKNYGITLQDFDDMMLVQEGCCALCKSDVPRGKEEWHVDHCHVSGRIRGILCSVCNRMLGLYEAFKKYEPESYIIGGKYGLPIPQC